ncbi:helix-turn-helix domain-containing protein [Ferruginibacter profundus]
MKLFIKYMVSIRCKMVVKAELDKMGLHYGAVDLGEVEVKELMSAAEYDELKTALARSGLELMYDKNALLIEKVKSLVIEMVHYTDELPDIKNSAYISEKLQHEYSSLAALFSEATGTTIEHFIIIHKIERVKEMLLYSGHNLTEIAYQLNYSSVAHLSNQFKKITGLTPSFFKKLRDKRQTAIDNV